MSATTRRFISRNVPSRCIFFLQDAECAIDVVARTKKPSERRVREKAEAVRRYRKAMRKRLEREGY